MDPNAALEMQVEAYRRMSGEQRLEIALRLHELSCDVAREGIRDQFPNATNEKVERELHWAWNWLEDHDRTQSGLHMILGNHAAFDRNAL